MFKGSIVFSDLETVSKLSLDGKDKIEHLFLFLNKNVGITIEVCDKLNELSNSYSIIPYIYTNDNGMVTLATYLGYYVSSYGTDKHYIVLSDSALLDTSVQFLKDKGYNIERCSSSDLNGLRSKSEGIIERIAENLETKLVQAEELSKLQTNLVELRKQYNYCSDSALFEKWILNMKIALGRFFITLSGGEIETIVFMVDKSYREYCYDIKYQLKRRFGSNMGQYIYEVIACMLDGRG